MQKIKGKKAEYRKELFIMIKGECRIGGTEMIEREREREMEQKNKRVKWKNKNVMYNVKKL